MAWVTCETGDLVVWGTSEAYRRDGIAVFSLNVGRLGEPPVDSLRDLTPTERQRADRYRQPADRLRFLYGRLLLRWVGYRLTGQPVQLRIGPYGKPDFPAETGWHVNLSHAGDWVVVAIDRKPVGVDVELYRADLLLDALLPTAFSSTEQVCVQTSDKPDGMFLQLWTRKEALLKAIGRGLVDDLTTVPALDGRAFIPSGIDAGDADWRVLSFTVDSVHSAAVAYQYCHEIPAFYQLTASDLLTYSRLG